MIKILTIDDEQGVCDVINKNFSMVGYKTFSANNSMTALELFKREQPDVVFLDIMMPGVDGFELLKSLKTINDNNIVIMVSALRDPGSVKKAKELGALDFITKPFSLEHLRDLIAQNIDSIRRDKKITGIPNILIADDEEDITYSVKSALSKRIDANIDMALRGDTALAMIQKKNYDLIILDISMPGLNGIQILENIKKEKINTQVLVISGWKSSDVAAKAIEAGALDFITKPLTFDIMMARIKVVLTKINKFIPKPGSASLLGSR